MKVTIFIGSARKKHTYYAAEQFISHVRSMGNSEYELVSLSEYRLEPCTGCKLCFDKGELFCPLKDDRDVLINKLVHSDGVVFASPTYAFQVSGLMKTFLDRISFFLHRPFFFGKTFTSIVVQGLYGARDVVKYLDFVGGGLGFNVVKGCYLTALEPVAEKDRLKFVQVLNRQSRSFQAALGKPAFPAPSLFRLMAFRMSRTSIQKKLDSDSFDYNYYHKQGWFTSSYYYPAPLGFSKKAVGKGFDYLAKILT
jgi:multimeric flavodoxin WrbA